MKWSENRKMIVFTCWLEKQGDQKEKQPSGKVGGYADFISLMNVKNVY